MREDDRGAHAVGARAEQAVGADAALGDGSSSSASRRPAGPGISRSGISRPGRLTRPLTDSYAGRSTKSRTSAANASGRVIVPRWPVRSSTTAARAGNQPGVLAATVDRHDVIERRLAGDDERRRGDAVAVGGEIDGGRSAARARPSRGERDRRGSNVRECHARESPPSAPASGSAATISAEAATATRRRTAARTAAASARRSRCRGLRCQPGPGVDARTSAAVALRPLRGETQGDEAAERDAADDRAFDAADRRARGDLIARSRRTRRRSSPSDDRRRTARTSARGSARQRVDGAAACTPSGPECRARARGGGRCRDR